MSNNNEIRGRVEVVGHLGYSALGRPQVLVRINGRELPTRGNGAGDAAKSLAGREVVAEVRELWGQDRIVNIRAA